MMSSHDRSDERGVAPSARVGVVVASEPAYITRARERGREIVVLRENGFSLDEIAERYGVSRERVRQILRANNGPGSEEAVLARRRRTEAQAQAQVSELLARWRSGGPVGEIAAELGIQAAMCSTMIDRFATSMDRAARRASIARARGRGRTYSDRDILDALALVATRLGEVPTPRQYAALARELALPSVPTIVNRFHGWTTAVRAAGMHPRAPARAARQRRWTEDECWRALLRAVQELGEVPTLRDYEQFAASRSDMPSSATARKRLGRWSAIAAHLTAARTGALCSAHAQFDDPTLPAGPQAAAQPRPPVGLRAPV